MVKKTLMIGVAAALLMGLLFGRDAASYATTAFSKVRGTVKDAFPVGFELDRAKKAIVKLDPAIRDNMRRIGQEEVEVAKLEKEVGKTENRLAKDRVEIMRLKGDLDRGGTYYTYAGRQYSIDQVKADLKNRFDCFKSDEATSEKLQQVLRARQASLKAAREKLEAMLVEKRQLEVAVANLEARMQMLEVAKTTSEFKFDNSQLARTRQLIDEISTRLDVEEKLVNADTKVFDRIPLDTPKGSDDILDQVTQYFNPSVDHVAERIAQ